MTAKKEAKIALLFSMIVFTLAFISIKKLWIGRWAGDAAQLYDILFHLSRTGRPLNSILPSIIEVVPTLGQTAQAICALPFPRPSPAEIDHFRNCHPYFVLYLLAPFARIFPVENVIVATSVFTIFGLIGAVYGFLRIQGVKFAPAALFCFAVTAHPAWSYAWFGQPYVDRFFYLPGFLLLVAVSLFPKKTWVILILMALCCTINDRVAVITGCSLAFYSLVRSDLNFKNRTIHGLIGAAGFLFGIYLLKFFVHDYSYTSSSFGQIGSISAIRQTLELTHEGTWVFMIVNFLIFGMVGWRSPRSFAVAVFATFPNLFITIGGAERTGWLTHYHATYFPILVWAVASGYAKMQRSGRVEKKVSVAWAILAGVFLSLVMNPQQVSDFSLNRLHSVHESTWFRLAEGLKYPQSHFGIENQATDKMLPNGVEASVTEFMMPALIKDRRVLMFPAGLDDVDYVVEDVLDPNFPPEQRYRGAYTYHPGEQEKLNRCFYERMKRDGWDMAHPQVEARRAIFRRIHPHDKF